MPLPAAWNEASSWSNAAVRAPCAWEPMPRPMATPMAPYSLTAWTDVTPASTNEAAVAPKGGSVRDQDPSSQLWPFDDVAQSS
jgi:hypothetical protein